MRFDEFYDDIFGVTESVDTENNQFSYNNDILYAAIEAVSTKEMQKLLLLENMYICNENNIALEGATSDSLKAIFGDDMKNAKERLSKAKKLIREGKRSEARKEIIAVRKIFVKIHEDVAKVKQGPISFFTSAISSIVLSPYMSIVNISNDLEPDVSSRLISKAAISTIVNLLAITRVKMPIALAAYISGLGIGQQVGTMLSNKFHKINKNEKGERLSDKAGLFNDIQRDVLYILKLYIENCDKILEKI